MCVLLMDGRLMGLQGGLGLVLIRHGMGVWVAISIGEKGIMVRKEFRGGKLGIDGRFL